MGIERLDQMLARARKFTKEEVDAVRYDHNWQKWGMVAGFKTTPEKFAAYMRKRAEEDRKAKGGQ